MQRSGCLDSCKRSNQNNKRNKRVNDWNNNCTISCSGESYLHMSHTYYDVIIKKNDATDTDISNLEIISSNYRSVQPLNNRLVTLYKQKRSTAETMAILMTLGSTGNGQTRNEIKNNLNQLIYILLLNGQIESSQAVLLLQSIAP